MRNHGIAGRIVIQQTKPDMESNRTQSPSFKRRVLEAARADKSLDQLYWFVEFRCKKSALPPHMRSAEVMRSHGDFAILVASYPGRNIPVVSVAPDPVLSADIAQSLLCFCRTKHFWWGSEFNTALVDVGTLRSGYHWYEWGDRLPAGDEFCRRCGGVGECWCERPLALVAGRGVTHLSQGGQRALCGKCVQGAKWVAPLTTWERRRLGEGVCRNCERVWRAKG